MKFITKLDPKIEEVVINTILATTDYSSRDS